MWVVDKNGWFTYVEVTESDACMYDKAKYHLCVPINWAYKRWLSSTCDMSEFHGVKLRLMLASVYIWVVGDNSREP